MLACFVLLTAGCIAPAARIVDADGARSVGVAIRPSPGKGLGAFTTVARDAGELVGDYVGEIFDGRAKDARYLGIGELTAEDHEWISSRKARGISINGHYIVNVGMDTYIDAEDPTHANWCRYINHSSRPNVALKTLPRGMDGRPRAWFVTLRVCAPGDELCFDYGPEFWLDEAPVEDMATIPLKTSFD